MTVDRESVWKLTQKVRGAEGGPAEVSTTNTYLSREEFERLLGLPAHLLVKTREICVVAGATFAVDTFHGPLAGLRLAEVEVVDLHAPLAIPAWLGREVTHEDRFSGGRLAAAMPDEAAALLAIKE